MTPKKPSNQPGNFSTTCWTQVLSARGDSELSLDALSDLCDLYYEPILVYLRSSGHQSDKARDLAHDFFADLLRGDRLNHLDREKGRFRSYLLGSLKHFLSHQRSHNAAQKRGSGAAHVSLNETGAEAREGEAFHDRKESSPDILFDRQWALTVLNRSLQLLEEDWKTEGKTADFQLLRPWLTGDAAHGDQASLAESLGMPINTVKSTIRRLRQRFRKAVKAEVARTLDDPKNVDEEMAVLFSALG